MKPGRLVFLIGTLGLAGVLGSVDAAAECRIKGFPDSIRQRLINQFQGSGCDFDLIVNGRKVIKSFCSQWLNAAGACPATQSAAQAAQKCISAARVDGSIAQALNAYGTAWNAWQSASSKVKNCDKQMPSTVTYKAAPCNAYDPRTSRGTWRSQVTRFCSSLQRSVSNFTAECDKRLPRPKRPNEYLMGRSGPIEGAINGALSSAVKNVGKCHQWAQKDLYAAAGEAGCDAKASIDHALRMCSTAQFATINPPKRPTPTPKPSTKAQGVCEKVFEFSKNIQPGELWDKYIRDKVVAMIKNRLGAAAARCGFGVIKGALVGIPDMIFKSAETICSSIESCLESRVGQITGGIAALLPPLLLSWVGGCYAVHVGGKIAGAASCLNSLMGSPTLRRALALQAGDFLCELAGSLILDIVAGLATGGGSAGASVGAKIARVAAAIKKFADTVGVLDKAKMVTLFDEVKKVNAACGKYGVNLPTSVPSSKASVSSDTTDVSPTPPAVDERPTSARPSRTGATTRRPSARRTSLERLRLPSRRRPARTTSRTPRGASRPTGSRRKPRLRPVRRPSRTSRRTSSRRTSRLRPVRRPSRTSRRTTSRRTSRLRPVHRPPRTSRRTSSRQGPRRASRPRSTRRASGRATTPARSASPTPPATSPSCTGVMTTSAVNLRAGPSKSTAWLGLVFRNHTFEILEEDARSAPGAQSYVKVRWKGKVGYLPTKTIEKKGCR